jgi:Protein of unknown function (DUF4240)
MNREQFWELIEAAKTATGGDCQAQAVQLVAALGERSVDGVLAWDRIYGELMAESYGWDLWGAAYLINGGCSGRRLRLLPRLAAGPRTRHSAGRLG